MNFSNQLRHQQNKSPNENKIWFRKVGLEFLSRKMIKLKWHDNYSARYTGFL